MIEIKICGITNLDDALAVAGAGADALGFIFYPRSSRYVTPESARGIIERLPRGIAKVGIFVNDDPVQVREIAGNCNLDFLQFHGDETPAYCARFPVSMVIKAFSPRIMDDLERLYDYPVRAILVDAFAPGMRGGTGKTANWELAREIGASSPLILSGGLNSGNIQEAIESVSPRAVDINSGVEASPGKKDYGKVRRIIAIVRRCGQGVKEQESDIFHDGYETSRTYYEDHAR